LKPKKRKRKPRCARLKEEKKERVLKPSKEIIKRKGKHTEGGGNRGIGGMQISETKKVESVF